MTDNSDRDGLLNDTTPLGKSVEEVEADGRNQVNPSVGGEHVQDREFIPAIMPGQGGTAGIGTAGAALNPTTLVELDENGPDNPAADQDTVNQDKDETPQ